MRGDCTEGLARSARRLVGVQPLQS
jgi:hypothetical protein